MKSAVHKVDEAWCAYTEPEEKLNLISPNTYVWNLEEKIVADNPVIWNSKGRECF